MPLRRQNPRSSEDLEWRTAESLQLANIVEHGEIFMVICLQKSFARVFFQVICVALINAVNFHTESIALN